MTPGISAPTPCRTPPSPPRTRPAGPPFYYHEFREGLDYTYSEDCQYLNIWAPDNAEKAPVIVYIHGGAFLSGSGWDKVFDEPVWPRRGVIGVTLNYRLGLFGYACLPELADEAGHTGNYGLYDQLCALQWVHDNIAAFGGDPDNITVMGQSAGAHSVQMLCSTKAAQGLIAKAVMSSGAGDDSVLFAGDWVMEHKYPLLDRLEGGRRRFHPGRIAGPAAPGPAGGHGQAVCRPGLRQGDGQHGPGLGQRPVPR